jgi:hypothetical protein
MHPPCRRSFKIFLCGLAIGCANADFSDPVGYMSFDFVAGKKGALAVPLAQGYRMGGTVSATGTDYIEFATDLPPNQLGIDQSACLDVRSGPGAGQSLQVTGISGRRVSFDGPALMPIAVGTSVAIRPNWSLGELLGSPPRGAIQQGASHESADIIGLQDPATQTTREFFYKSGSGWREIGREMEGDRSATALPFRSSLQFFRRGASDLRIVLDGAVPMFSAPNHWIRVWPGRNLVTTPFSPAKTIDALFVKSSLVSGRSAPRSDSFRLVYADASLSKLIYLDQVNGWMSVPMQYDEYDEWGQPVLIDNTRVDLSHAMDFQRNGAGGYVGFNAFSEPQGLARSMAVAEQVIPVDTALSDFPSRRIGWASIQGTTYQVQTRTLGSAVWNDYGSPVMATGDVCQKTCMPEGAGIFRIVVR